MADGQIDIKEDASPTKELASQTHLHGGTTVHAEEVVIVDAAGNLVGSTAGRLNVDGSGVTQPVSDGGGAITVDALDLDIRNLVPAQDVVRLGDGTDLVNITAAGELNVIATAQPGIDVGDVTVNNAAGASAVNVQDGGNSLTVDNATISVVGGGTEATAQRVTIANDSTGVLSVDDNGGALTVDQATAANLNAQVVGEIAHDGVDSGNPIKIGGKSTDAAPTAVANNDRVQAYFDRQGRQVMRPWGIPTTHVHFPASNTQATVSKSAGGAGVRHVCVGVTAVLAGGTTAPAAAQVNVALRDGASGAGTIVWQAVVTLPAVAGAMNGITRSGLFIEGTANTAMTLEFSAAGGANTFESVSMEIVTITEA